MNRGGGESLSHGILVTSDYNNPLFPLNLLTFLSNMTFDN
jgi:hypothetical protein